MKLLSFDPGISTGWVILDHTLEISHAGTFLNYDVDKASRSILLLDYDYVVMEQILFPQGPFRQMLQTVWEKLQAYFPNAAIVRPGQWKPVMKRRTISTTLSTRHEKDAALMGMYYLDHVRPKLREE